ncbi:hypothetical protein ACIPPQ_15490 [Sphingopyxis sp. LARHCG72]
MSGFKRHVRGMADSSLPPSDVRVRDAIHSVYRHFATPAPSAIEGCPCCVDTRNVDVLLTTPLPEITAQALWRYVSGAYYTIGSDQDFRYLLPRILEISVNDPGNANNPEIVLNKLALAQWRSWGTEEQQAVSELLDAWFERALEQDLSEAEDGWVGREAEGVLCGAALAGFPLDQWLARLTEPFAAPVLDDLKDRFPGELSPFWEQSPNGLSQLSTILAQGRA